MNHDSTWLSKACAMCRARVMAPVGLLLACALLAGIPAAAAATTTDMRGEWELNLNPGSKNLKGIALIPNEANAKEEFVSSSALFEGVLHGTFSVKPEGGKATVSVIIPGSPPFPEGLFNSEEITIESGVGTLSMSGLGTFDVGGEVTTGTFAAKRLRTQLQIEEQEAQERREREEREARARVRGEWSLTIESGPQVVKGTALISKEANSKNEFSSSLGVFESVIPGSFSGTLKGSEAAVQIVTQAAGPFPESTFTDSKIAVAFTSDSMSMTGTGTVTIGANTAPATLTATRTKTYQEVVKRETEEREAREAKEKQEREAREASERAEREASEKAAREASEKQTREAREAAERAAAIKSTPPPPAGNVAALVSVELAGKSLTTSASGLLSLQIANPNAYAISGRVTLVATQSRGAGRPSAKRATSLGTASFGISPNGKQVVKLKLSQRGRSELARHKTLHATATIATQASGQTTATKTFSLTLRAAKPAHSKH